MGPRTCIAEKIISEGADYILAAKDNRKSLREEVEAACKNSRPVCDLTETEKGHGRIETRRCRVFEKGFVDDPDNKWTGLQTVIEITAARGIREEVTTEKRHYISGLDTKAPFNRYIREHWGVENSPHRTPDMVFGEDDQRKRDKGAAKNFAIVRKISLNLLKKDKATKGSLVSKRLRAGWDKDYLLSLLKF